MLILSCMKQLFAFSFVFIFCCSILFFSGCFQNQTESGVIHILGKKKYASLTEALQFATDNDTLVFSEGIFEAGVHINQTLSLKGEHEKDTILYCDQPGKDAVIMLNADNCHLENLSIRSTDSSMTLIKIRSDSNQFKNVTLNNGYYGVYLTSGSDQNSFFTLNTFNCSYGCFAKSSMNNTFVHCSFFQSSLYGIFLSFSSENKFSHCSFMFNDEYGSYIDRGSNYNHIQHCDFSKNGAGLRLKSVKNCSCFNSSFKENDEGLVLCCGSNNNTVAMNAFVENKVQATDEIGNQWSVNNTGNFWNDYQIKYPLATADDGVWTQPYEIDSFGIDKYPLVLNPPN